MNKYPTFFETNEYFIDQKVNYFKFEADYKVFDQTGQQIGMIRQRLSASQKLLRLLISKSMLPFHMDVIDNNGNVLATIKRGWTFFMSEISISNEHSQIIGYIKQKFKFFKPTFHIFDSERNQIAFMTGDWKGWNFSITHPDSSEIGNINKKWAGAMKEIFTTADKYNVSINENYNENTDKIVIVSTAITVDMVLKESN